MPRVYLGLYTALLFGAACWFLPLFRVIPLSDDSQAANDFDAQSVADHLWNEKLPGTFGLASDAATVLELLLQDSELVRQQYGITRGVRRGFLLYLHGKGQVVAIDKKEVTIRLHGSTKLHLRLRTGMIFGSEVRDATRLTSSREVPSTEQLNAISDELNLLVESRVISTFVQRVVLGDSIDFIACFDVKDPNNVSFPLVVVPVSLTIN